MVANSTLTYTVFLPNLLLDYNSYTHSSLQGYTPNQITNKKETDALQNQYGECLAGKNNSINSILMIQLELLPQESSSVMCR